MEKKEENDLFFVCSLIEYIARKTSNKKKYIIEKIGKDKINKIYNLADVYHSENIDKIVSELIEEHNIDNGNYCLNLNEDKPTFWEIGRVYKNLILKLDSNPNSYIDNLMDVLSSWIIEKIDDYNSSLYYENPDYIYNCYIENKIL